MIDNLNRIKRILSAKLGAEIPKFLKGAKFKGVENGVNIYSDDGLNWYLDENLTSLYKANYPNIASTPINAEINLGGQNYTTSNNSNLLILENKNIPVYDNSFTNSFQNSESLNREQSIKNRIVNPIQEVITLPQRPAGYIDTTPEFTPSYRQVTNVEPEEIRIAREKEEKVVKDAKNEKIGNGIMAGMNAVGTIGDIFGQAQSVNDSDLTKGITSAYDGVASAVSNMGPYGQVVGAAMNAVEGLGNMALAMGGGTDQMSKLDLWMDSPLLSWNVGMLNGFAGKNSDKFSIDQETLAQVGSSYGGSTSDIMDASEKADKKYGLFSSKSRKKANAAIANAKSLLNLMSNIANTAADLRLAVQSMGEQAGLAYSMMIDGGYNLKYTYAAKEGGVLNWTPEIKIDWEPKIEINWELPIFKDGGEINNLEELEWIPLLQKGNKVRTIEELIEYAKKENPRFIQRFSEEPRGIEFIDDEGNKAKGNIYLEWSTDDLGNAIVYPRIQEMDNGELKYFENWRDAYDRAIENNNILIMSPEEAKLFTESGEDENGNLFGYKIGWPEMFKSCVFKQGGTIKNSNIPEIEETTQKNLIPEGALHKNKHHMEHAEGLTKKGIPVIDENGEQQAEIEHSEIIFTLEVTKKLEEYYEIFYSEESTNKEKEQAALDAGKLLVYQILENTDDRTNLIDSCKKGGTLNLKKSTDDLIEEWIPTIAIIEEKPKKESKKSDKEQLKETIKEVLIELLTK